MTDQPRGDTDHGRGNLCDAIEREHGLAPSLLTRMVACATKGAFECNNCEGPWTWTPTTETDGKDQE